ncbi:class I SAM-dependent methyltransferase [Desertibaculum subflavum]|uniref:class I SAM-dependent methyltransferase n=1 Tax=Desertibaculum subflavum TaxID=2268458 RepID=UPI0013C4BCDD
MPDNVLAHHRPAAEMWGLGGAAYDEISFGISDALAHAAQRLNARPGQRILDVATGTGWSARNAARTGAEVTGIDISGDLLAAAQRLSAHIRPAIDFRQGDAEQLPFPDASFDGAISTFGVMFAANHERAAAELARVLRPGGRLVLATWVPGGAVAQFFAVVGRHAGGPPPEPSPLAWGDPAQVARLLGGSFDLAFERGTNNAYYDDVQQMWDWFSEGFGPVRQLARGLPPDRLEAFRRDVDDYHRHYAVPAGLHVRREYLVVIGRRK